MDELLQAQSSAAPHPDVPALDPPGRVALVGAGAFGRFSIDAYRQAGDLDVVAVADPNPDALAQVNAPEARLESDWQRVISDDRVEVVHVATPPFLRREIVFASLQAGKSVFCEKPLALSLEEADAMITAAKRAGVALGVDYVMRHLPAYRILTQLAASQTLGNLRSIAFDNFAQSLSPQHWFWDPKRSGGIFVEHGMHFFDAYGQIAGSAARVHGSAPRREAVEATVQYGNGAIGRFYHEFAFPIQVERAVGTSFFERGYVEIEGWIPTRLSGAVMAPGEHLQRLSDALVVAQHDQVTRFHLDFADREAAYAAAVVSGMRDLVRRHRDPTYVMTVPIEDARASLALALAAQRAATTGTLVDVPSA